MHCNSMCCRASQPRWKESSIPVSPLKRKEKNRIFSIPTATKTYFLKTLSASTLCPGEVNKVRQHGWQPGRIVGWIRLGCCRARGAAATDSPSPEPAMALGRGTSWAKPVGRTPWGPDSPLGVCWTLHLSQQCELWKHVERRNGADNRLMRAASL